MATFIIGAHGQIGQLLVADLADTGEPVYAGIRQADQAPQMTALGGEPLPFDLMGSIDEMTAALQSRSIDQVVFTAGSGGATGAEMTLNIDLDGAIKAMIATKQAGINRFILVSALRADDRRFWEASGIRSYYVAKYYADQWLTHRTTLDYTIIRPGILTNDAGTGTINLQPDAPGSATSIPRADVAALLTEVVQKPTATAKRIIEVVSGPTPIPTAF